MIKCSAQLRHFAFAITIYRKPYKCVPNYMIGHLGINETKDAGGPRVALARSAQESWVRRTPSGTERSFTGDVCDVPIVGE